MRSRTTLAACQALLDNALPDDDQDEEDQDDDFDEPDFDDSRISNFYDGT
jgi:hypothetical protein